MKTKNNSKGWIALAMTLSLFLILAQLLVATDKSFQVVYTKEHITDGYGTIPAGITVHQSAALGWQGVAASLKATGWIAIVLIWVGCFAAYKWDYKLGTLGTPWGRIALTFGPVLLAAILWFAGYSSRQDDLKSYKGTFDKFREEMQISDGLAEKIKTEGGSGTLHIADENGRITAWFKAQMK